MILFLRAHPDKLALYVFSRPFHYPSRRSDDHRLQRKATREMSDCSKDEHYRREEEKFLEIRNEL
jgi:hypothetical protein